MTYREGTWAHDYSSFQTRTGYRNAIVWVNPDNGRVKQINFTNATTPAKLSERIQDLKTSSYYNNPARNCNHYILSGDTFNSIVDALRNNMNPGSIKELAQGTVSVSTLRDKNVYIVWNKTTATFLKATETEAEALTAAKDAATKNTNQAFLVLKPDSVAYQPVSITVDKVS